MRLSLRKVEMLAGDGPTQADMLIDLAQTAELFHAPDGTGFADLDISGHRETWPIRAKGFRRWLARRFFEATQGAPSTEALQSALNVIERRPISMLLSASSTSGSPSWTRIEPCALTQTPPLGRFCRMFGNWVWPRRRTPCQRWRRYFQGNISADNTFL
jgi:hypothetical protein